MRNFLVFLIVFTTVISAQEMVSLKGGSFKMGSSKGGEDEKPEHLVTLSPYSIDKYEVTNEQYDACVKKGRCKPAHYTDGKCYIWSQSGLKKTQVPSYFKQPSRPVVCVSWMQARDYCKAQGKRLPTEAEWEYAATAGGNKEYSTKNAPSPAIARYKSGSTAPVGSFPDGYGQLKDMCGNSWEWVNDRYEKEYYQFSPEHNPKGPGVGRFRVIRGGGWYSSVAQLRGKNRHWFAPEAGEASIGFRCAK